MAYPKNKLPVLRTPAGCEYQPYPSQSKLNACAACGRGIDVGEPMVVCSDCGAQFCETCVTDGTFDAHDCDELDYEDETED